MDETEKLKSLLAGLLSNMEASNVDMIADAIEGLIDHKVTVAMNMMADRLPEIIAQNPLQRS